MPRVSDMLPTATRPAWASLLVGSLLLFVCLPLFGAESRLRLDHITAEDGLAHSLVFAIGQDDRGFLWFGTRDGLSRFDGYGFETYRHDPKDPDSLSENSVRALHFDPRGELWIGTDGGGLERFVEAEERFRHYRHDPADPRSLSHGTVWTVFEDRTGRIWAGTEDGLNRLDDRAAARFTRFQHDPADPSSLPARRVMSLAEDGDGRLWVGTEGGGLARFDAETESFVPHPLPSELRDMGPGTVLTLTPDARGGLWIGTDYGFGRLDLGADTLEVFAGGKSIGEAFCLLPSRGGEVWVGSYTEGLGRFDPETRALTMFHSDLGDPGSLSSNTVFSLFEDRAGSLWIGTRLGVDLYPRMRDQFALYRNRPNPGEAVTSNLVRGVYEDHEGEIWVGTGQGLAVLDRESRKLLPFEGSGSGPLSTKAISAIHEDHRGHLWTGIWLGGMVELDAERRRALRHRHDPTDPGSLCDDQVRAILEDRARRLWVGTFNGLCHFDFESRRFVRHPRAPTDPESFGYGTFWTLHEQRDGTLWFGSFDGLYRLDPETGLVDAFRSDPSDPRSLGNNKILSLYEDHRGRMWIGTQGGGLHRFDASRRDFFRYQEQDGLAHDSVEAILEDGWGHLWVSTSGGLSRLDPDTGEFLSYTVDDGLQGNIFSSSSALASSSGELFFGGYNGLTGFFPERLAESPDPAPVVLTRLSLFNEPVRLARHDPSSPLERSIGETSEIVLTHHDYVFAFEFAALDYVNARRMEFAYKLDGFDREWIPTGSDRRFARYTNLDAGTYRFRVRARSPRGAWSEDASIRLGVRPPPWKTWWAYSLYALAAVLAVGGLVEHQRRRLERERAMNRLKDERMVQLEERLALLREREELIAALEKRNLELERFHHAISHDLKNPLLTIKTFVGAVQSDLSNGSSHRLSEDLRHIDVAAEELRRLLESLTELLKIGPAPFPADEVALGDLVREAARSLSKDAGSAGVEIEIAGDLPVVRGDRQRLFELFRQLLDNAVKFMGTTAEPRIEIGRRRMGGRDVIFVRDNGPGIEAPYQDKVFGLFERLDPSIPGTGIGLAVVKRIVEAHGGEVWVESEGRGRGSALCLTLATRGGRQATYS